MQVSNKVSLQHLYETTQGEQHLTRSDAKSKPSRTVLGALSKPNPNATPRPRPAASGKPAEGKPLVRNDLFKTPSVPTQTPAKQVRPHGTAPKSTKKAISIYTPRPARARRNSEHEVEHAHPASPRELTCPNAVKCCEAEQIALPHAPSSPLRNMMESADDFGPIDVTNDLDFDAPGPLHAPHLGEAHCIP